MQNSRLRVGLMFGGRSAEHDLSHMTLPDAPQGIPGSFDEHINLMMDLILLAYQGNITRIAFARPKG